MLTHLDIKNFAIIENLSLELKEGFTVLTGETGAGKSIVIDALQLVLGERAENNVIRHNADRCEITANFDLTDISAAKTWLINHELSSDEECILRRVISRDGKSRSTINGISCPLQMLRELGALLVNIHGQHEHQSLLKRDKQRELLDDYAGHQPLCESVQSIYRQWSTLKEEYIQLQSASKDSTARIELWQYQVRELEELNLGENEIEKLEQNHKKLTNAEQIISRCNASLDNIKNDENISLLKLLHNTVNQLESIKNYHPKINNAAQLLNEAIIQTEEAAHEIQDGLDLLELNTEELTKIEERLDKIHVLARKHKIHPKELFNHTKTLQQELKKLMNADEQLVKIQSQIASIEKDYFVKAKELTHSRTQTAIQLAKTVTEKMQTLGMRDGKLSIEFSPLTELNAYGAESVEFKVSANPGQPLQLLNKVASGGELSRISLAIQVITAQKDNTPTLIFDEVDVGVGGSVAEIVGKLLKTLGKKAQVLSVTHLPQVAAQGHQHFQITKKVNKDVTQTLIKSLNREDRIQEIARMLGGIKITTQTLAHAQEMLIDCDS